MRLVADVGGTNSRLALSQAGSVLPGTLKAYCNADWDNLYAVIADYLFGADDQRPCEMVIAVAGPVQDGQALLTNRGWTIESAPLVHTFGCKQVHLLNDLTGLGYAVPQLGASQLTQVCDGTHAQSGIEQSLVVGIGTGFNVSPVLEYDGVVLCPATEAGHISMPLGVADQLAALGIPKNRFPTVEDLFSGRGFTAFCRDMTGRQELDGSACIAAYGAPLSDDITATVDHYSALLGWLLRDLFLSYMPSSGIYLAGSVARAVATKSPERCVEILQDRCDIRAATSVSVWVIEDDGAALLGCAGYSWSRGAVPDRGSHIET